MSLILWILMHLGNVYLHLNYSEFWYLTIRQEETLQARLLKVKSDLF